MLSLTVSPTDGHFSIHPVKCYWLHAIHPANQVSFSRNCCSPRHWYRDEEHFGNLRLFEDTFMALKVSILYKLCE